MDIDTDAREAEPDTSQSLEAEGSSGQAAGKMLAAHDGMELDDDVESMSGAKQGEPTGPYGPRNEANRACSRLSAAPNLSTTAQLRSPTEPRPYATRFASPRGY